MIDPKPCLFQRRVTKSKFVALCQTVCAYIMFSNLGILGPAQGLLSGRPCKKIPLTYIGHNAKFGYTSHTVCAYIKGSRTNLSPWGTVLKRSFKGYRKWPPSIHSNCEPILHCFRRPWYAAIFIEYRKFFVPHQHFIPCWRCYCRNSVTQTGVRKLE